MEVPDWIWPSICGPTSRNSVSVRQTSGECWLTRPSGGQDRRKLRSPPVIPATTVRLLDSRFRGSDETTEN